MNILELLVTKTGKGIKVAVKDTAKGLETAGKDIGKAVPTVATVVEDVSAVGTLIPEVSQVFSVASRIAGMVAKKPASDSLPASNPVSKAIATLFQTSITGDSMNPLESFGITMVLGILQTVVKNPAHKAALENQLIGVADQIYMTYGMTPPSPAPSTEATK